MAAQNKPKLNVRATALRSGISASHVSCILSGKRSPSLPIARRLVAVCGMGSLQGLMDLIEVPDGRVDDFNPSLAVIRRFAAACGMTLDHLADLIDAPPCGPSDTAPVAG